MPSKPQPFRLPQRFDSPTLAKLAISGEPTVIVRAVGVGSTAPFEYSDRNGRQAIFRYEQKYDAHVLKVPASIWNANKGFMAHELMDQRRLPHPLVVTVEVPTPEMDALGKSEEASDVVVGQVSEQPGASASVTLSSPEEGFFSPDGSGTDMPTGNVTAPLYSRAWDMLESPMRLKDLVAALETDADTLKTALQEPLSTVELGHAGWVKRREPKA